MPALTSLVCHRDDYLMHGAKRHLANNGFQIPEEMPVTDVLHADDTLIVDMESTRAQQFMTYIGRAGANYGFTLPAESWKFYPSAAMPKALNRMVLL